MDFESWKIETYIQHVLQKSKNGLQAIRHLIQHCETIICTSRSYAISCIRHFQR